LFSSIQHFISFSKNTTFIRKTLRAGFPKSEAKAAGRPVRNDRADIGFAELRYAPV
jgi:hypothetical protein